jgi:Uncharacterized conserved protein (DUF2358)
MNRRRRIAPPPRRADRIVALTGIASLMMVSWILPPVPLRTNALLTSTSTIRSSVSPLIAIGKPSRWSPSLYALLQESDQREKEQSMNGGGKKDDDEFALHIGRALDTLRNEYPHILTQSPDFSLYDEDIEFCLDLPASPLSAYKSSIHGMARYKMMWDLLHGFLRLFYHTEQSYMSSVKLCHDRVRGNVVRVQWHAVLFPRWHASAPSQQSRPTALSTPCARLSAASPPPPSAKCHHIDGISVYELDWRTGKIVYHRMEQMVYTNNAQPVMAMEEVMLRRHAKAIVAGGTIPVQSTLEPVTTTVEFQNPLYHPFRPTSLFAMEAEQPTPPSTPASSSSSAASNGGGTSDAVVVSKDSVPSSSSPSSPLFSSVEAAVDMVALEAKNKSRQKFGLKPLTPTEFLQVQKEVMQLATVQKEKAVETTAQRLAQQEEQQSLDNAGKSGSLFDKVFGSVVKNLDTCESNFDCVRPQVCCDYVFAKKCCTSGSMVSSRIPLKYAVIPVYAGGGDPNAPPPSRRYMTVGRMENSEDAQARK